jgi:hypothetical protein
MSPTSDYEVMVTIEQPGPLGLSLASESERSKRSEGGDVIFMPSPVYFITHSPYSAYKTKGGAQKMTSSPPMVR